MQNFKVLKLTKIDDTECYETGIAYTPLSGTDLVQMANYNALKRMYPDYTMEFYIRNFLTPVAAICIEKDAPAEILAEIDETLNALKSYPLINEDELAILEAEARDDAIEDFISSWEFWNERDVTDEQEELIRDYFYNYGIIEHDYCVLTQSDEEELKAELEKIKE